MGFTWNWTNLIKLKFFRLKGQLEQFDLYCGHGSKAGLDTCQGS